MIVRRKSRNGLPLGRWLTLLLSMLLAACSSGTQEWQLTNITGHLPDLHFNMTGDDGQPMDAGALKGHVVMVYFGYTHCPDICPLALTHMHVVLQRMGKLADNVRILFVTVDPRRDTPEVLHQYVRAFDKRAVGLTGSDKQIRAMTKAYRVVFNREPADKYGNYEVGHSSAVFIFDRRGRARLISTSADNIDAMTHDLTQLVKESQ